MPFILVADKLVMNAGESQQLRVDSLPSEGVDLEATHGTISGMKYTARERSSSGKRNQRGYDYSQAQAYAGIRQLDDAIKRGCKGISLTSIASQSGSSQIGNPNSGARYGFSVSAPQRRSNGGEWNEHSKRHGTGHNGQGCRLGNTPIAEG